MWKERELDWSEIRKSRDEKRRAVETNTRLRPAQRKVTQKKGRHMASSAQDSSSSSSHERLKCTGRAGHPQVVLNMVAVTSTGEQTRYAPFGILWFIGHSVSSATINALLKSKRLTSKSKAQGNDDNDDNDDDDVSDRKRRPLSHTRLKV